MPRGARALTCLVLVVAVVLPAGCSPGDESPAPQPAVELGGRGQGRNVVMISVDTLRADRLGAWGYETRDNSPTIDGLVERGVRFQNAHAPRALTWPSLATVLTGLYPSGHGLVANGFELADDQPTLPTVLQTAGYRTGAFLSNMCKANHRGWDTFDCSGGVDQRANRGAINWLSELAGEDSASSPATSEAPPFLLWVHYFGAHSPYYNGGERALELDPGYAGPLRPKKWALDRVMLEGIELDERDLAHLDAIYDAAVMGTDHYVAQLLSEIERLFGLDDTIVVFLADHGEDLYDHHRYLYHACSVYETSLHVPLAVVAPGLVPAGSVVDEPVGLESVLPTLLDLLGLESPSCLDGPSLVPQLGGTSPMASPRAGAVLGEYGDSEIFTVVEGRYKLIGNPEREVVPCMQGMPPDFYPIGETELYDLDADPGERRDLHGELPDVVERLRDARTERRQTLCTGRPKVDPPEMTPELREELEALGYVVESAGEEPSPRDEGDG